MEAAHGCSKVLVHRREHRLSPHDRQPTRRRAECEECRGRDNGKRWSPGGSGARWTRHCGKRASPYRYRLSTTPSMLQYHSSHLGHLQRVPMFGHGNCCGRRSCYREFPLRALTSVKVCTSTTDWSANNAKITPGIPRQPRAEGGAGGDGNNDRRLQGAAKALLDA